jgi:hypothetical protein
MLTLHLMPQDVLPNRGEQGIGSAIARLAEACNATVVPELPIAGRGWLHGSCQHDRLHSSRCRSLAARSQVSGRRLLPQRHRSHLGRHLSRCRCSAAALCCRLHERPTLSTRRGERRRSAMRPVERHSMQAGVRGWRPPRMGDELAQLVRPCERSPSTARRSGDRCPKFRAEIRVCRMGSPDPSRQS